MSARANYFKLGLFVLAGATLLVAGLIILGVGAVFEKKTPMETYLNESVQGLEVGSPVKYRGVKVGTVREISFTHVKYKTDRTYVYVGIDLDENAFGVTGGRDLSEALAKEVEKGLRIKLSPQGITGLSYLEGDYLDPRRNAALAKDWEPASLYVPSAPGLFTQLGMSIEQVFARIEKTDIEGIVENLKTFLTKASKAVDDAEVARLRTELITLLQRTQGTAERLNKLLEDPKIDGLPGDVAAVAASARRIMEASEPEVARLLKNASAASDKLTNISNELDAFAADGRLKRMLDNLTTTSDNVKDATGNLPETLRDLSQTLRQFQSMLNSQQAELTATVRDLRDTLENIEALSATAKDYPASLIFGEPPPRSKVTE